MKLRLPSVLLLSLLLLTACNKEDAGKSDKQVDSGSASGIMAKAAEEIRMGNMSLGNMSSKANTKGEITLQGDLLIDGKPVSITAEQRQLLIRHRELLVNIAISGVDIGMQGVDLAKKAVGESINGIFNGNTDQVEKKVEAEAKKIEESANLLCEQLPLLLESQQKLADALTEFKPYATMTVDDINDCRDDIKQH